MPIIRGNDSPNALTGTSLDDTIFGYDGDDTIEGGGEKDWILGGFGTDSVNGGAGDDVIEFRASEGGGNLESIHGGFGFDTLLFSSLGSVAGAGAINFFFTPAISSIERLKFNSSLNDVSVTFHFHNAQPLFSPQLEFVGGNGKDTVEFNTGGRSLDLRGATFTNWQAGDSVSIRVEGGPCTINASAQADDIWAETAGSSLIKGNGGDDVFHCSYPMLNTIDGGAGRDCIVLNGFNDISLTRIKRVEDIVFAASGTPFNYTADFYSNAFDFGLANPAFHFIDMDAHVNGVRILMFGSTDTHFSAARFTFENWGASNIVAVVGGNNDDTIIGSLVTDYLSGGNGNDYLRSGLGGDSLFGSAGTDGLNGGDGDDYLVGGGGLDRLIGSSGNDTFAFEQTADSGAGAAARDRILDFGSGDKIDLSQLDASAILAGDQAFVLDTDGVLVEGEIRLVGAVNTVIEINLDADAEADMEIGLKGIAPGALSAADFIL